MADHTLKYRDLLRRLKAFNVREIKSRGKGSERLLQRVVGGVKYSTSAKCHSEGDKKPVAVIRAIRRRLKLTEEDGVSDSEFYGH